MLVTVKSHRNKHVSWHYISMNPHVLSRSNVFIQHFASRANVWSVHSVSCAANMMLNENVGSFSQGETS